MWDLVWIVFNGGQVVWEIINSSWIVFWVGEKTREVQSNIISGSVHVWLSSHGKVKFSWGAHSKNTKDWVNRNVEHIWVETLVINSGVHQGDFVINYPLNHWNNLVIDDFINCASHKSNNPVQESTVHVDAYVVKSTFT